MVVDPANAVRILSILIVVLAGLIWVGLSAFFRIKRGKTWVYLLFFGIFWLYIYHVLDLTLFQYQSLVLLRHFSPDLRLSGQPEPLNLIPLVTLTSADIRTSLLNILMLIPFGFGLPFLIDGKRSRIILSGILFSFAVEALQLMSGLVGGITFRIADINDVIFNTVGVAVGYGLFVGFIHVVSPRLLESGAVSNPIWRFISDLQRTT